MSLEGAACRGKPLDWFYPADPSYLDGRADALCKVCPCVQECLDEAMGCTITDDHGIRAGLPATARWAMRDGKVRSYAATRCLDCGCSLPVVPGRGRKPDRCGPCGRKRSNRSAAQRERDRYQARRVELFDQLRAEVAS